MLDASFDLVHLARAAQSCVERTPTAHTPLHNMLDILTPAPQARSQARLIGQPEEFVVNDIAGAEVTRSDNAGPQFADLNVDRDFVAEVLPHTVNGLAQEVHDVRCAVATLPLSLAMWRP
jgi:hypothetical protein